MLSCMRKKEGEMTANSNAIKIASHAGRAGFTLVEIMLVVVIIGMLAGVAVVGVAGRAKRAAIMATRQTIAATGTALDAFEVDNGVFPNSLNELVQSTGMETWQGPYIRDGKVPTDAWNQPIQYSKTGDTTYKLVSGGPDKQIGGSDDITN